VAKKGRNIEKLNDEGWITDIALLGLWFFEPQGKDKLVSERCDNIEAFEVKLRLWENQLNCVTLFVVHTCNLLQLFIMSVFSNVPSISLCIETRPKKDAKASELRNQVFFFTLLEH
jgi:hypothetical protein